MTLDLEGAVVVVTGATSGVGRATARAFAERGAAVVPVARSATHLEEVAAECRRLGGAALPVPADTADPVAVDRARGSAVGRFGRVDVWVNAASVGIVGHFGDEPLDEARRLVDTNIWGYLVGSRIALEQFKAQKAGTLVNISSLLGVLPNPMVPTYVMSKFAVRGLSMSLQQDRALPPEVHVCTVLPGPIDTPFFARAANHSGRRARAIPPAVAPERVAAKVVSLARRPRAAVTIGAVPHVALVGHRVAPRFTEWAVARYSGRLVLRAGDPVPDTGGALSSSPPEAGAHGGWRRGRVRRLLGERLGRALARRA